MYKYVGDWPPTKFWRISYSPSLFGSQVMLNVVGRLMEASVWLVRFLTFDAHCAHSWFREALFGSLETLSHEDRMKVPFFKNLEYSDLPRHALPHLPLRLATYDGLPVAALPGACFLVSSSGFTYVYLGFEMNQTNQTASAYIHDLQVWDSSSDYMSSFFCGILIYFEIV